MRILNIRFKNIHSLKGEHEINFQQSPLFNTGIFAITGPTGSGKSTILDAISLALYNRTPRIGQLTRTNVENYGAIITKNTDECFTEVEYLVNGHTFRSKWEISRARTGNLRDYHMEIASLDEDTILDLKKSEVPPKNEKIIGLNYEQFVKSILLSQGEFARFLKANAHERGELLEKITGTGIYRDIGKAAYQKLKEERITLEKQEAKLEGIQLLNDEEIKQLQDNAGILEKNIVLLKTKMDKQNQLLQTKQNIEKTNAEIKQLQTAHEKIKAELQAFEPDMKRLEMHEKLLRWKDNIAELMNLKKKIKDTVQQKTDFEQKIPAIETEITNLCIKIEELDTKRVTTRNEFETLKPKLKQVKEYDNESENLKKSINEVSLDLQEKNKHLEKSGQAISKLENTIKKNKLDLDKSALFLQENTALNDLEENFSAIEEKINQADERDKKVAKLISKKEYKTIKNQINGISREKQLEKITIFIAHKQEQSNKIEQDLGDAERDMNTLQNQRDKLRDEYQLIKNLGKSAREFSDLNKKYTDFEQKKQAEQKELTDAENDLKQKKHELEIVEKHIEELQARKERQQLEKNYENDRKSLEPGKSCPLCGSKEHPFVRNYSSDLPETQKQFKQKKEEHKKLVNAIQLLDKKINRHETQINFFLEQLQVNNDEIKKIRIEFQQSCEKNNLQLQIDQAGKIKEKEDQTLLQGKKITTVIEKVQQLSTFQQEITKLSLLHENLTEAVNSNQKLNSWYKQFEKYIPESSNNQVVLNQLKQKRRQFRVAKEKVNELNHAVSSNTKVLTEKIQSQKSIEKETFALKEKINNLTEKRQDVLRKRNELLGDNDPEKVESEIQQQLEKFQQEKSSAENELTKLKTEKQNLSDRLQESIDLVEQTQQEKQQKLKKLQPNLQALGFESPEKAHANFLAVETVNTIREKDKKLSRQNTSLSQSLNDKQIELKKWNEQDDTSISKAELEKESATTKQEYQKCNQEMGGINSKLKENEQRKTNSRELNEQIEKQRKEVYRWENLARLIGDAEGKKFSKFAQELTLIQLLGLANKHLKNLNERYYIKKSEQQGSDDILVVDQYQGNAERSVKTLSGGESFLASMSLALGLSDLAGKNTKIESLFIDEGFGSLDQETLDIALSALEKLQSETNRTIGIISHVPSLKERIKTQIELKKTSTGHSTISISS